MTSDLPIADKTIGNRGERLGADNLDRYAIEHLHRYVLAAGLVNGLRVLDIASGEGYGSNLLAQSAAEVIGVDIDSKAVSHASLKYQRPNLKFRQGSATAIPLDDASVDFCVSFETLEHHDKHEEMIKELRRVLKPGGVLMISTPNKLNYTDRPQVTNEFHVKELYTQEFLDLVSRQFPTVELYFQEADFLGLVMPSSGSQSHLRYFSEPSFQGARQSASIDRPIYNIVLATDLVGVLPALGASVMSGTSALEFIQIEVTRLQRRIDTLLTTQEEMRASLSFRIGRALTFPLRLLSGRGTA
jgi:2-polyprenyl-3-methyl-5-hydroxy-6-metoxy-1,4-benzoquinol methylase